MIYLIQFRLIKYIKNGKINLLNHIEYCDEVRFLKYF